MGDTPDVSQALAWCLATLAATVRIYTDMYQEDEARQIEDAAMHIQELVDGCFQPHPDVQQMYEWSSLSSSP